MSKAISWWRSRWSRAPCSATCRSWERGCWPRSPVPYVLRIPDAPWAARRLTRSPLPATPMQSAPGRVCVSGLPHRPCRMWDSRVHWNCGSVHKIVHEIRHATSQLLRGELMEARVTAQSQGLKLRERMEEARIQHGQEVRVDLPRIAVAAMAGGTAGEVFFCKLGAIRVREVRNPGNDRPLPTTVRLEGLTVPHSGGTTSSTPWCTRTGISGSWWTPRPRW